MEYHRDHQNREYKVRSPRHNNTPPDPDDELDLEPAHDGSEYAPTAQATERERMRHKLERQAGRVAAGTLGNLRAGRGAGVTRATMDDVAKQADRAVSGRRTTTARKSARPAERLETKGARKKTTPRPKSRTQRQTSARKSRKKST